MEDVMHYTNMSLGNYDEYVKEAEKQEKMKRLVEYKENIRLIEHQLFEDALMELLNEKK
jgi:hypothetical protein